MRENDDRVLVVYISQSFDLKNNIKNNVELQISNLRPFRDLPGNFTTRQLL